MYESVRENSWSHTPPKFQLPSRPEPTTSPSRILPVPGSFTRTFSLSAPRSRRNHVQHHPHGLRKRRAGVVSSPGSISASPWDCAAAATSDGCKRQAGWRELTSSCWRGWSAKRFEWRWRFWLACQRTSATRDRLAAPGYDCLRRNGLCQNASVCAEGAVSIYERAKHPRSAWDFLTRSDFR